MSTALIAIFSTSTLALGCRSSGDEQADCRTFRGQRAPHLVTLAAAPSRRSARPAESWALQADHVNAYGYVRAGVMVRSSGAPSSATCSGRFGAGARVARPQHDRQRLPDPCGPWSARTFAFRPGMRYSRSRGFCSVLSVRSRRRGGMRPRLGCPARRPRRSRNNCPPGRRGRPTGR